MKNLDELIGILIVCAIVGVPLYLVISFLMELERVAWR